MKEKILDFLSQHGIDPETLMIILLVCLCALLLFCIFTHLVKIAVGIAVVVFVVPILFTVFFGDGSQLIKKATDYMNPEIGQQIESSYDYFKDKEKEHPILDVDAVNKAANHAKDSAKEKIENWLE